MNVIRFIIGAFLDLPKQFRLSYLPPLLVYLAAGISGLTAIVGTFFIKDYLNLSAAFLAGLGFWAGLPWALKMPLGHLVDLIWKHKNYMVYFGASIIAASLLIMHGLIGHTQTMATILPVETWYVVSVILAPIGFVVQDVVADAMTVEAVPKYENVYLQVIRHKNKRTSAVVSFFFLGKSDSCGRTPRARGIEV